MKTTNSHKHVLKGLKELPDGVRCKIDNYDVLIAHLEQLCGEKPKSTLDAIDTSVANENEADDSSSNLESENFNSRTSKIQFLKSDKKILKFLKELPATDWHKVHNYEILLKHLEEVCSKAATEYPCENLKNPEELSPAKNDGLALSEKIDLYKTTLEFLKEMTEPEKFVVYNYDLIVKYLEELCSENHKVSFE